MALSNDNMWGYATDVIAKHKVRWIEMAAFYLWTCIIVYYVEGDRGHVMNEVLGRAESRYAARGIV